MDLDSGTLLNSSGGDGDIGFKLQYFYQISCPSLANYDSQRFWNQLVAQASHAEQSVHHLVLAIACLDYHDRTKHSVPFDNVSFARHYVQGLTLLHRSDVSVEILLIGALLLIICDEMRNNPYAAVQHIIAGQKILNAYRPGTLRFCRPTVQQVVPIFSSLAPYPGQCRPYSQHRRAAENLSPGTPKVLDHKTRRHPVKAGFKSIGEALHDLKCLIPQCLQAQPYCSPPSTRFHVVPIVTSSLNTWATDWDGLLQRMGDEVSHYQEIIKYLDVIHRCLTVMSRCVPFDDESLFDKYLPNFEYILLTAGQMTSPSVYDLVPSFFFAATRCRDPALRHQAITALHNCAWEGRRLATIVKQISSIEGQGLSEVITCEDIPHGSRVVILGADISDDSTIVLTLKRKQPDAKAYTTFQYPLVGSEFDGDAAVSHALVQLIRRTVNFDLTFTADAPECEMAWYHDKSGPFNSQSLSISPMPPGVTLLSQKESPESNKSAG
ncbi:hypothetical protein LTR84_006322 [Exophiala bonariae]|uniref:Transcription factor domain-containing protein n=1 Tax=Exophiala bonariae TaxID=1690606 RepID=A0AAV9N4R6_9EURO|nr:hypothetical protein LTR84_006322 [Exophiala bonariae]